MDHVALFKAAGFQVWMRKANDSHCLVTDGKRIAYVQWSNYSNPGVSTVHKPNKTTGTGFRISDEITIPLVSLAMAMIAPSWADSRDIASVRKYRDWTEFHSSDSFNSELFEV